MFKLSECGLTACTRMWCSGCRYQELSNCFSLCRVGVVCDQKFWNWRNNLAVSHHPDDHLLVNQGQKWKTGGVRITLVNVKASTKWAMRITDSMVDSNEAEQTAWVVAPPLCDIRNVDHERYRLGDRNSMNERILHPRQHHIVFDERSLKVLHWILWVKG